MAKRLSLISFCFILFLISVTTAFANIDLRDNTNSADYLIIYPKELFESVHEFIEWRQQSGLSILSVDIDDIYEQFNSDSSNVYSIRDFILYAVNEWQEPAISYILFFGGTKSIPSYRVASSFANLISVDEDSVSIDEWFVLDPEHNTQYPVAALGRFPVDTNDEAKILIDKIMLYETYAIDLNYPIDFLLMADEEFGELFEISLETLSQHLPDRYQKHTIHMREDSPHYEDGESFINRVQQGVRYLIYYGHGHPEKWSKYEYLTIQKTDKLDNTGFPFFLSAIACSQNFDLAGKTLPKRLLTTVNGGAAGMIVSSGINWAHDSDRFQNMFFSILMDDVSRPIGDIFRDTKDKFISPSMQIENSYSRMTLLADPFMKLPFKTTTDIQDDITLRPDNFNLSQNYPNPFNNRTIIEYDIPFNSHTTISVYDILGRKIRTIFDEHQEAGRYQIEFNADGLPSGVYFYTMTAGEFRSTGRMVYQR